MSAEWDALIEASNTLSDIMENRSSFTLEQFEQAREDFRRALDTYNMRHPQDQPA